jgi:uncharacterized protein
VKMERRTLPITEIRAAKDDEGKKIKGYAAVFNSSSELLYGAFREIIQPGAFSQSLRENDIRALFDHNTGYVLGRNRANTLELKEDGHGLQVTIDPPDTQWARDLLVSIERGDINQMSFGFQVRDEEWIINNDGHDVRVLRDVNLHEVSLVAFPAYTATEADVRAVYEQRQLQRSQELDIDAKPTISTDKLRKALQIKII